MPESTEPQQINVDYRHLVPVLQLDVQRLQSENMMLRALVNQQQEQIAAQVQIIEAMGAENGTTGNQEGAPADRPEGASGASTQRRPGRGGQKR